MSHITSQLVLAFCGHYFDDAAAPVLDGPCPEHPELAYGPAASS